MHEKSALETVNKELFDRVWSFYTEMGTEERHFNGLQSTYRALASTWLLAAFAAIGFVLSEKFAECPFDKLVMVAVIGFMAAIGIWLIWIMDLRVYHPLLSSAFRQGRLLEETYPWLPQMRTDMMHRMNNRGVVLRVVWFYIAGISIPVAISGVALAVWRSGKSGSNGLLVYLAFAVVILVLGKGLRHFSGAEQHYAHGERHKGSVEGE